MVMGIHDPAEATHRKTNILDVGFASNIGVSRRSDRCLCRAKAVDQIEFAPHVSLVNRHGFTRQADRVHIWNHGWSQELDDRRGQSNVSDPQAVDGSCEIVDA